MVKLTATQGGSVAPAIRVSSVGKTYRMWSSPGARLVVPLLVRAANFFRALNPRLAQQLIDAVHRRVHTHVALSDINLELGRGEALGIIGLNGSGKSTLLQIIAGVLPATTGTVQINGRVAALLELGSGFNPELSGRENIFINAAILGLSRRRVDEVLDDIIRFADIGNYIEEPVKTYSSGMALRLAFAVQVHTDPDILIVDEALAVGDAAFQAKAMTRIDSILAGGTTLLFVGHDLNAVKAFCHRAMLLEKGRIVHEGMPDEVITEYLHRTHLRALEARLRDKADLPEMARLADGYGVANGHVSEATLNGAQHATLAHGQRVRLAFKVRLDETIAHPGIIVDVLDGRGLQLTGRRIMLPAMSAPGEISLNISFDASFMRGIFRIRTRVIDSPSLSITTVLSRQEGSLSFEIVDDSRERFTGLFLVPMEIDIQA